MNIKDELEKRGYKVLYGERTLGISATMIRENPDKYWRYISAPSVDTSQRKFSLLEVQVTGKPRLQLISVDFMTLRLA